MLFNYRLCEQIIMATYGIFRRLICCRLLCTVVLSFLPYTTGKQQLDLKMLKIRHFRSINRSQRDDQSAIADIKTRYIVPSQTEDKVSRGGRLGITSSYIKIMLQQKIYLTYIWALPDQSFLSFVASLPAS